MNSARTPRVLVTGVGGPAGRGLVSQLRERGAEVVGVDARQLPAGEVPTEVMPVASDPGYLGFLRRLVLAGEIDIVIPTVSEELPILAQGHQVIPAVVVIAGSPAVLAANDKYLTARRLAEAGVGVPRTLLASDFDCASAASPTFGDRFILKPRVSRGSRDVHVVRDGTSPEWHQVTDGYVVQEFAPGAEYCVAAFVPADQSAPVAVTLRKTGLTHGVVGNATGVERMPAGEDEDVARVALSALQALGLVGPADVDVRRRADGVPVVLEVNARFGANHHVVPEVLDAVLVEAVAKVGWPALEPV